MKRAAGKVLEGLGFSYQGGRRGEDPTLHCDRVPLPELATRFSTPLYVYSASLIRDRLRAFDRAFGPAPHTICYSVKANSNLSILRLLAGQGCGIEHPTSKRKPAATAERGKRGESDVKF